MPPAQERAWASASPSGFSAGSTRDPQLPAFCHLQNPSPASAWQRRFPGGCKVSSRQTLPNTATLLRGFVLQRWHTRDPQETQLSGRRPPSSSAARLSEWKSLGTVRNAPTGTASTPTRRAVYAVSGRFQDTLSLSELTRPVSATESLGCWEVGVQYLFQQLVCLTFNWQSI